MTGRRVLLGLFLTGWVVLYAWTAAPGDRGIPEERVVRVETGP